MTHLKVDSSFIDEISKNTFLREKVNSFTEHCKNNTQDEFLKENPDFLQMVMHLSSDERIKFVDEE